ncbi:MAG: hypothetical protein MJZ54_01870 [Bacteroidaceae bacterium]|nr:hypothetical protein [Bacteroidaceae bacterium]
MGKSTAAKGGFLKKMRKTERKMPKNASRSMQKQQRRADYCKVRLPKRERGAPEIVVFPPF